MRNFSTHLAGCLIGLMAAAPALAARAPSACSAFFADSTPLPLSAKRAVARYFKDSLRLPSRETWAELAELPLERMPPAPPTIAEIAAIDPRAIEIAAKRVLRAFGQSAKASGRMPSNADVAAILGLKPEEFEALLGPGRLFADRGEMKEDGLALTPASFKYAIDTDIFNAEATARLLEAVKTRSRLIVTTAVADAPVNEIFFKALLNYAQANDAEILVFPANMQTTGLDPILTSTPGVHVITHSIELSPYLTLNKIKIAAKQINSLTGLDRLGRRGESQIVGAPKMMSKTLATMNNTLQLHRLYSTSAVTDPAYNGAKYIQGRTDEIARQDHWMGALILEKGRGAVDPYADDQDLAGLFHVRHIEYIPQKGGFRDLNKFYFASGKPERVRSAAMVLPDIHVGVTNQRFLESLESEIRRERPREIIIHDLMDMQAINHWDRNQAITMARNAGKGLLSLEQELRADAAFLNGLHRIDPQLTITVTRANHDVRLMKWLQEGEFMKDPQNMALGIELADAWLKGNDPIPYALKKFGLEYPERIVFLAEGTSKLVAGVEVGLHGDWGANGGRGSMQTFVRGADRSVFGHTHTDQRNGGTVNIGTGTDTRLPYSDKGFSSWSISRASIGPDGDIQVLQYVDGQWSESGDVGDNRRFFWPDYPNARPNVQGEPGGVDQWSN